MIKEQWVRGKYMSRKVFEQFEDAGETIIGGLARYERDFYPKGLERPGQLVLPGAPETIERFRVASHQHELLLEIGPGKGKFITALALQHPESILLGAETRLSSCLQTLERASKASATNVWVVWGDARVTIPRLVAPATAKAAFIMFPDPWWKRGHAARRHGSMMAAVLADVLMPGGLVVIKSDIVEYIKSLAEAFRMTGVFAECELPEDLPLADREFRLQNSGIKTVAVAMIRR